MIRSGGAADHGASEAGRGRTRPLHPTCNRGRLSPTEVRSTALTLGSTGHRTRRQGGAMSPNPTTSHLDQDTEGHTVRRRRIALIAVCATAFVASAGGIALARGGDDPASVPAPAAHTALTCVQLAQMG